MFQALRQVLAGGEFFSPSLAGCVSGSRPGSADRAACAQEKLSDRENEVLKALAMGLKTREIAENFSISRKTIESHCENLKRKLGLSNIRELVTYAARRFGPECSE